MGWKSWFWAVFVALALTGCNTVRIESVQGLHGWNVGEYRNCTLDPAGVAVLSCAATSDVVAQQIRVVYQGHRTGLDESTKWECLRETKEITCKRIFPSSATGAATTAYADYKVVSFKDWRTHEHVNGCRIVVENKTTRVYAESTTHDCTNGFSYGVALGDEARVDGITVFVGPSLAMGTPTKEVQDYTADHEFFVTGEETKK